MGTKQELAHCCHCCQAHTVQLLPGAGAQVSRHRKGRHSPGEICLPSPTSPADPNAGWGVGGAGPLLRIERATGGGIELSQQQWQVVLPSCPCSLTTFPRCCPRVSHPHVPPWLKYSASGICCTSFLKMWICLCS